MTTIEDVVRVQEGAYPDLNFWRGVRNGLLLAIPFWALLLYTAYSFWKEVLS